MSSRSRHEVQISCPADLATRALAIRVVGLASCGRGEDSIDAVPDAALSAADRDSLPAAELAVSLVSSTYIDAGRAEGTLREVAFGSSGNARSHVRGPSDADV